MNYLKPILFYLNMEYLYDLAKQLDELSSELLETNSEPHHPTYFDYVCLSHELDSYMQRAFLLSKQLRRDHQTELDEFWRLRDHHWNPDNESYERILLLR